MGNGQAKYLESKYPVEDLADEFEAQYCELKDNNYVLKSTYDMAFYNFLVQKYSQNVSNDRLERPNHTWELWEIARYRHTPKSAQTAHRHPSCDPAIYVGIALKRFPTMIASSDIQ